MSRTDHDMLSTAPPEESCVQVDDDPMKARAEGRRYIDLIRRTCGSEPEGAELRLRSNPHDFGTYYTVALFYDDEVPEHVEYMKRIEWDGPLEWDEEAPVNFDYGAGRNPNF